MVDKVGTPRNYAVMSAGKRLPPKRPKSAAPSAGEEQAIGFDVDAENAQEQGHHPGKQQPGRHYKFTEQAAALDKEKILSIIETLNKNPFYLNKGLSFKLKHDTQESVQVVETKTQKIIQVFSLPQLIELWARLDHNDHEFLHRGSLVNITC